MAGWGHGKKGLSHRLCWQTTGRSPSFTFLISPWVSLLALEATSRVFLNLWFGKPMVCVRVAFHENDGNHENDENDEDNSDSYKQGVECWIRRNHGKHENDENHENPGCKPRVPQTIGLEIPEQAHSVMQCAAAWRSENPSTLSWTRQDACGLLEVALQAQPLSTHTF